MSEEKKSKRRFLEVCPDGDYTPLEYLVGAGLLCICGVSVVIIFLTMVWICIRFGEWLFQF